MTVSYSWNDTCLTLHNCAIKSFLVNGLFKFFFDEQTGDLLSKKQKKSFASQGQVAPWLVDESLTRFELNYKPKFPLIERWLNILLLQRMNLSLENSRLNKKENSWSCNCMDLDLVTMTFTDISLYSMLKSWWQCVIMSRYYCLIHKGARVLFSILFWLIAGDFTHYQDETWVLKGLWINAGVTVSYWFKPWFLQIIFLDYLVLFSLS